MPENSRLHRHSWSIFLNLMLEQFSGKMPPNKLSDAELKSYDHIQHPLLTHKNHEFQMKIAEFRHIFI